MILKLDKIFCVWYTYLIPVLRNKGRLRTIARCPYLDYESHGALYSQGEFICKLCNKIISEREAENKCKSNYGDEYEKCPIYKNRWLR